MCCVYHPWGTPGYLQHHTFTSCLQYRPLESCDHSFGSLQPAGRYSVKKWLWYDSHVCSGWPVGRYGAPAWVHFGSSQLHKLTQSRPCLPSTEASLQPLVVAPSLPWHRLSQWTGTINLEHWRAINGFDWITFLWGCYQSVKSWLNWLWQNHK